MRFGFVVPNSVGVTDPNELIELATYAEALGFDSVWALFAKKSEKRDGHP